MQFCFATVIRESARLILGNKDEPHGIEGKWPVLTSCDVSSLVIDRLCYQDGGQNSAVACFYIDLAIPKEQSSAAILGALLKQVVGELEEVPGEILQAYENQRKAVGEQGPQLSNIVKMLQIASSEKRTFICIDALDECAEGHRIKLLDSLNKIFLVGSPGIRIFMTGRPHILPEIRERLAGRIPSISISLKRDDIVKYLYNKLGEDMNFDAMDSNLEVDILKKISEEISET